MKASTPKAHFSEVLDKLALSLGLAMAFMLVMPAYEKLYPVFKPLVLSYTPYAYQDIAILLWWAILFFVLTCTGRFIVLAVVGMLTSLLTVMAVKLTLWRSRG